MKNDFSVEQIKSGFAQSGYICNDNIAMTMFLAHQLEKPVLVEGPPGVGKTELAKATAQFLNWDLIRLQCYEGLDEAKALYEWKYGKQLLYTQVLKDKLGDLLKGAHGLAESIDRLHEFGDIFYSEQFLEPRPLLQALQAEQGTVLLIDEIDKADNEFESFLLEMLSDYQISIPEIGTIKARRHPIVFLTSNNTRELSDALKRRCLHLFIPFPDATLERSIIQSRVPGINDKLRQQLVGFVQEVRKLDLKKQPAISETIDWARTLLLLHSESLSPELVETTLNVLLKHEEDINNVKDDMRSLFNKLFKS
ncbi:AAA family ATPase [Ketobacter alkanivorans]|uniref:ATPase n=1 Tax=Ketobacter alkanivorans TaxID=1917421 RepID=A0A2K9LNM9_9GAMM|nr:MoxR family ATPase [Ketobacter alkanivorans]AUM13948.1 ATPase [Ketobacter alkanivorans]MCP5017906.1 MoxR family ATPase [Ketobacter sp.]